MPYPLGHRGFPELHCMVRVMISDRKINKKFDNEVKYEKARGHPGLNQGPLDLQSNALPLSYIPMCESVILYGIYPELLFCRLLTSAAVGDAFIRDPRSSRLCGFLNSNNNHLL